MILYSRFMHFMENPATLFRRLPAKLTHHLGRWPQAALPDAVYRDLVETLFSMRLPILGLGILYVLSAAVIFAQDRDPVIAALMAAAAALTAARLALLIAYQRRAGAMLTVAELRRWERSYAIGSHAFALLLAGFSVTVLQSHAPLNHLLVISLIFTFGAGIVSRIGVRPAICVTSLLLATVPAIIALAVHAGTRYGTGIHSEYFIVEAFLLAVVTALSLESVRHLHRTAVEHLTVKHDLAHLVRQDALTGLPNRLMLRERFRDSLPSTASGDRQLALHFLDLDGFKAINDRYGHLAGDAVLREVALRLNAIVRSGDTVARLGGDEFIVIQADVRHEGEAEMLARRIIRNLSAPYQIMDMTMHISVSIGIAMAPRHGLNLEHLTACADAALYRSKRGGKAQLYFCTPEDVANAARAVA